MPVTRRSTVVITGASTGIGRALAFEMARRGHALCLTARRMPLLEQCREDLRAAHGKSLPVALATFDVRDLSRVGSALQDLFARAGGVDMVVVNAGANDITSVGSGDLEKELNLIQTNLAGAIATIHAATEHFVARGRGHIVGISSLASLQPIAAQAAYCASKAGFSMYLESARIELRRKGIAVTHIRPGYIKTDIVANVDIGKLPFAITVEQAAREMAVLIEGRAKAGIVPAFPWKLLRPLMGHIPERFLEHP